MRPLTCSLARDSSSSEIPSRAAQASSVPMIVQAFGDVVRAGADVGRDHAAVGVLLRCRSRPRRRGRASRGPRGRAARRSSRRRSSRGRRARSGGRRRAGSRVRRSRCGTARSPSRRSRRGASARRRPTSATPFGRGGRARRACCASATIRSCSTWPAAATTMFGRGVAAWRWYSAMSGTGIEAITSASPSTRRPSGCSPKTASARTSWTRSCGSSSYIAISSSTTWRSESTSG